jgi:hypothetical protein
VAANITAFRDNGRGTEQAVCYRVMAFNEHGNSAPSNVDCTTPAAKPTGLAASATAAGIGLSWADNSNVEEGYQVQRSSDGATFSTIANLAADATAHTDAGAAGTTTYSYRVRAKKDGGFSDFSNVASATWTGTIQVTVATTGLDLDPDGYVATVTVLTSTIATGRVSTNGSVSFSALPADVSYRITLSELATNCAAATSQTTSLAAGATAQVRFDVSCVPITVPAKPTFWEASGLFGGMWLVWQDNSNNEDGFKIERCLGWPCEDVDFVLVTVTRPNVTTYGDGGLLDATAYTYRLRATNRAGDSAPAFAAGRTCSEEFDLMAPCY